ncbi:unnamed protein product [Pleuronectes platessa]|uniref:Uncharacterized protein n=1 Tax=Pleuronectes platessa TaxID=8262 RepID=A0A9N7ULJ2_PLEPL|nr:unnamed protein product [Pleuronectes platessa]
MWLFLLTIFVLINSPAANCHSSESDSSSSSESDSDERGNHFRPMPLPPWLSFPFWHLFPGLRPNPPPVVPPPPPPPPTPKTTTPTTTQTTKSTAVPPTTPSRGDNG